MFNNLKKLISLVFATVLLTSISSTSFAIDKLHFIIGGGAGGGWGRTKIYFSIFNSLLGKPRKGRRFY